MNIIKTAGFLFYKLSFLINFILNASEEQAKCSTQPDAEIFRLGGN